MKKLFLHYKNNSVLLQKRSVVSNTAFSKWRISRKKKKSARFVEKLLLNSNNEIDTRQIR